MVKEPLKVHRGIETCRLKRLDHETVKESILFYWQIFAAISDEIAGSDAIDL